MSREKLKDFLSQMGSNKSSISYVMNDLDGNGLIGQGDDLGVDGSKVRKKQALHGPVQNSDTADVARANGEIRPTCRGF